MAIPQRGAVPLSLIKQTALENNMSYYVYILSNNYNTTLYTGVTNNLVRRVYEHKNQLDPASFTAKYHVEKLVYYEEYKEPKPAIAREKQLKGKSRKFKNSLVEENNPQWLDLYSSII